MPGMWELPAAESATAPERTGMLLRHSILDTDYRVHVLTATGAESARAAARPAARWFTRMQAMAVPLTGLARKVILLDSQVRNSNWSFAEAKPFAPAAADWRLLPDLVSHTFTHFHLQIAVAVGTTRDRQPVGQWVLPGDFGGQALPTVMKKIVRHAMTGWK